MRSLLIALILLVTLAPIQAQADPIRGTLAPMPGKVGRALITWQVDPGIRQWWLYHCGPRDGACSVAQTGIGTGKGTLEVFSPQPNELWILKAVARGDVYYEARLGSIPADWAQRWILLPRIQKDGR